jgi:hypothetical protein
MDSRTTRKTIRLLSAFSLPGFDEPFDEPLPPGEYLVDRDDDPIESGSSLAWRRVATFIHPPAISLRGSVQQMVPIDPAFLETTLEQDRKRS